MMVVCRQRLLHHMIITHSVTHTPVYTVSSHNGIYMGTVEALIQDTLK